MHVPGWHERTLELQRAGRVQMVGIIQEQHPDRARLFMQWKQMGWPILVDSLNLLDVSVVPITLAIDEHGIIRKSGLRLLAAGDLKASFVDQEFEKPAGGAQDLPVAPDPRSLKAADDPNDPESLTSHAAALLLWGRGPADTARAITAFERALALAPDDGHARFRLGVAYRKRYDSSERQPGDFERAIEHWRAALEIDPNQYIWRRRIQQYGPRLDKPYPFYDWVVAARDEIRARGETPAPLAVEPGGAEFASPSSSFEVEPEMSVDPDPKDRIERDPASWVRSESVVVPDTSSGDLSRVHVVFRVNAERDVHWNNESEGLVVWLRPPAGWEVDRQLLKVENPPHAASVEPRRVEFEVHGPPGARPVAIPAYALYYVCEGERGTCMYRRQDLEIKVGS